MPCRRGWSPKLFFPRANHSLFRRFFQSHRCAALNLENNSDHTPFSYCVRLIPCRVWREQFVVRYDHNDIIFFIVAKRYESVMNATTCIILWWVVFFYTAEYCHQLFSSCVYFNHEKYYNNSKRINLLPARNSMMRNNKIYISIIKLPRKFANRQLRYSIFTNTSVTIRKVHVCICRIILLIIFLDDVYIIIYQNKRFEKMESSTDFCRLTVL